MKLYFNSSLYYSNSIKMITVIQFIIGLHYLLLQALLDAIIVQLPRHRIHSTAQAIYQSDQSPASASYPPEFKFKIMTLKLVSLRHCIMFEACHIDFIFQFLFVLFQFDQHDQCNPIYYWTSLLAPSNSFGCYYSTIDTY